MAKSNVGSGLNQVAKLVRKRSHKAGLPPGTPVFVGEKKTKGISISITNYDKENAAVIEAKKVRDCFPYKDAPTVTWINVIGLHEVAQIDQLCSHFGVHPLTVEDILNTHQRSKVELFDEYLFVTIKMVYFNDSKEFETEHVSIVLGKNFVLTFQEKPGDVLEPVRARIGGRGRITKQDSDYLAYALMDAIVDNYFGVLEKLDEQVENVEEKCLTSPGPETLMNVHVLKGQLIELKRSAWPLREIVNTLLREETPLIKEPTTPYLRDLYDHAVQVIDTIETHRDRVSAMHDIYLSSLSNRMNEVMKVLTIFASVFIPLTLIAGIYGMNFKHMPELQWPWGYFGALGLMAIVGTSLLIYFRRKKWL